MKVIRAILRWLCRIFGVPIRDESNAQSVESPSQKAIAAAIGTTKPVEDSQTQTVRPHSVQTSQQAKTTGPGWGTAETERAEAQKLDVASLFPGRSRTTVMWTQRFVDTALSFPGVKAERHDEGVRFEPNFVWIERVYTRDNGFIASFYGAPYRFEAEGVCVKAGRGLSYSRIAVHTPNELDHAIRAIALAWEWK